MEKTTVLEFLQQNSEAINLALSGCELRREPFSLYDSVIHVLRGKGKRLRPQLVLAASNMFDGNRKIAVNVALAVEIFHIFTLVHDDIMDNADERRGNPTIHIKWNEPTAILAGDYLLGKSSELLLALPDAHLRTGLNRFATTVAELCEGQIRDMDFETRSDVTLDEYLHMIDQKTSALLKSSLVLGALTGSPSPDHLERLDEIGYHLGRAFQVQDDLLDIVSDSHAWGKPVGGDFIAGKKAFLLLEGISKESTNGSTFFSDIAKRGGVLATEIPEVRKKLDEWGVLETARKTVRFHSSEATRQVEGLPGGIGKAALLALVDKMAVRTH